MKMIARNDAFTAMRAHFLFALTAFQSKIKLLKLKFFAPIIGT